MLTPCSPLRGSIQGDPEIRVHRDRTSEKCYTNFIGYLIDDLQSGFIREISDNIDIKINTRNTILKLMEIR